MQVRDGMSEVVLTVGPSHTLREAAEMMVEKGTGAALVRRRGVPVPCIVTERDLLVSIGRGEDPDIELVADHMSEQRHHRGARLEPRARRLEMSKRGIRHLVVFEDGGAGRRPLDPRHSPGLDQRRGDLRHDARAEAGLSSLGLGGEIVSTGSTAPRACCLRGRRK